jgi:hypothetical protein
MGRVHAGVVDVDENVGAGEAEVVFRGDGVGIDADGGAGEIVGGAADGGGFDFLDAREAGEGREERGAWSVERTFMTGPKGDVSSLRISRPRAFRSERVESRASGKRRRERAVGRELNFEL